LGGADQLTLPWDLWSGGQAGPPVAYSSKMPLIRIPNVGTSILLIPGMDPDPDQGTAESGFKSDPDPDLYINNKNKIYSWKKCHIKTINNSA
jgi:hypothetical protein